MPGFGSAYGSSASHSPPRSRSAGETAPMLRVPTAAASSLREVTTHVEPVLTTAPDAGRISVLSTNARRESHIFCWCSYCAR